jgi:hypothetical protein
LLQHTTLKKRIAIVIVRIVRAYSGRFIGKHFRKSTWEDLDDGKARVKTCQPLRERTNELRETEEIPRSRLLIDAIDNSIESDAMNHAEGPNDDPNDDAVDDSIESDSMNHAEDPTNDFKFDPRLVQLQEVRRALYVQPTRVASNTTTGTLPLVLSQLAPLLPDATIVLFDATNLSSDATTRLPVSPSRRGQRRNVLGVHNAVPGILNRDSSLHDVDTLEPKHFRYSQWNDGMKHPISNEIISMVREMSCTELDTRKHAEVCV